MLRATAATPAVTPSAMAAVATRRSSTRTSILCEEDMELSVVGAADQMMLRRIELRLCRERRGEAASGGRAIAAHFVEAAEVVVAQEKIGVLRVGHGEQRSLRVAETAGAIAGHAQHQDLLRLGGDLASRRRTQMFEDERFRLRVRAEVELRVDPSRGQRAVFASAALAKLAQRGVDRAPLAALVRARGRRHQSQSDDAGHEPQRAENADQRE